MTKLTDRGLLLPSPRERSEWRGGVRGGGLFMIVPPTRPLTLFAATFTAAFAGEGSLAFSYCDGSFGDHSLIGEVFS